MKTCYKGCEVASRNLPDVASAHDRFCVWCGWIIHNQALFKTAKCPNEKCKLGVPERTVSRRVGWIHCRRCDAFTHDDFNFCSLCGEETFDGARSRQRFQTATYGITRSNSNIVGSSELEIADEVFGSEDENYSFLLEKYNLRRYAVEIYDLQNRWKSTYC